MYFIICHTVVNKDVHCTGDTQFEVGLVLYVCLICSETDISAAMHWCRRSAWNFARWWELCPDEYSPLLVTICLIGSPNAGSKTGFRFQRTIFGFSGTDFSHEYVGAKGIQRSTLESGGQRSWSQKAEVIFGSLAASLFSTPSGE